MLKQTKPEILSYLWLAIENGNNLLFYSETETSKNHVLVDFANFIPTWKRLLAVNMENNELKKRRTTASLTTNKNYSFNELKNLIHFDIDALILPDIHKRNMQNFIQLCNYGLSLLATCDVLNTYKPLITQMRDKPIRLQLNDISLIDLAIFIKRNKEGFDRIHSITEYNWLNKAEIDYNSENNFENHFKTKRILENDLLDANKFKDSKVIKSYSDSYLITKNDCLDELDKRTEFLKSVENAPYLANKYFEIE